MKRSAPLRRTAFKRKAPQLQPRVEREPVGLAALTRSFTYSGTTSCQPVEKDALVRCEAYRRLVAALPCWACRAAAPSQAAHANYGKGMGMKTDDRTCFPLCPPCHRYLDQGGMDRAARRYFEERGGQDTRAEILAAGNWPKNLPLWKEKEKQ